MKKAVLLVLSIFCASHIATSQVSIELQVGGANFLGATFNSRFDLPVSADKSHRISPSFGIGMLMPGWDVPTTIINAGVSYNYKAWGLGAEVSGFIENPFVNSNRTSDFVDVIVYPNLNYTARIGTKCYFRFSAGSYFAYSKVTNPAAEGRRLHYESDLIPGAGIGFGYKIK